MRNPYRVVCYGESFLMRYRTSSALRYFERALVQSEKHACCESISTAHFIEIPMWNIQNTAAHCTNSLIYQQSTTISLYEHIYVHYSISSAIKIHDRPDLLENIALYSKSRFVLRNQTKITAEVSQNIANQILDSQDW